MPVNELFDVTKDFCIEQKLCTLYFNTCQNSLTCFFYMALFSSFVTVFSCTMEFINHQRATRLAESDVTSRIREQRIAKMLKSTNTDALKLIFLLFLSKKFL